MSSEFIIALNPNELCSASRLDIDVHYILCVHKLTFYNDRGSQLYKTWVHNNFENILISYNRKKN